ncbi:MAG: DUF1460 domain-containing protein [Muribaculaceae bacterium]|nr:DUF1460 domain-containing protein [Muribaculaceae bacterium]
MKYILGTVFAIATSINCHAILPSEAVFHNEASDTTRISEILIKAAEIKNSQDRTLWIAEEFVGTPYAAGTLEGEEELLRINLDSMDCTTFAETVITMAYTAGEKRTSWRDYVYNLERMRYRGGNINGYTSRLHYFSDWVVDNVHRGNIKEVTSRMPVNDWSVKTIDFMTENREKYPKLADQDEFEKMKNCEIGYKNHRFPYIKVSRLSSKDMVNALQDGDLIALTTKMPGLDVTHMGFIKKIDGNLHLIHASSKKGKVIIDDTKLTDYMRKTGATGIRVIRLAE